MFENLDATHLLMEISGSNGFAQAVEVYEASDFVTAAQLFRALAEQGDGEAQYNLGMMLHHGLGVVKNTAEAEQWLQRAAKGEERGGRQAQPQRFCSPHASLRRVSQTKRGIPASHSDALV